MAGAWAFAGFLDPVAVVPGAFDRAGAGPFAPRRDEQPGEEGEVDRELVSPVLRGECPAVPVAVRRIRRRAWAKEIRSGSRSAAADAFAVSALIAWWTIR